MRDSTSIPWNRIVPSVGLSSREARRRGLAAPARAEQDDRLALLGVDAEVVERPDPVAARVELDGEIGHLQCSHRPP
jgi:hypothetical protein